MPPDLDEGVVEGGAAAGVARAGVATVPKKIKDILNSFSKLVKELC